MTPSGECVRQADIIIHHIYIRIMGLRIRINKELVDILSEPLPAEGVDKGSFKEKGNEKILRYCIILQKYRTNVVNYSR